MKYILDHVTISTSDDLDLPGLLYEPENKTNRVAIYLHGNGGSSVFYKSKENKVIAEALAEKIFRTFHLIIAAQDLFRNLRELLTAKR